MSERAAVELLWNRLLFDVAVLGSSCDAPFFRLLPRKGQADSNKFLGWVDSESATRIYLKCLNFRQFWEVVILVLSNARVELDDYCL